MFRAEGLHKAFTSLQVTSNVSIELPQGRRHGLVGPNGAGKTTLFNLLSGELAPDSGRVFIGDMDLTGASPDARARAGLGRSFQRNNLFPDLSVRDNLHLACALQQGIGHVFWKPFRRFTEVDDEAQRIAQRFGLQEALDRVVRQLSYGVQRQLEIALTLALRPKILLLDEPTSGMSPEETAAMQSLIRDLPRDLTILIIEHDMDVVFNLAERITVIDYGKVLLEGAPEEVRASPEVRKRYFGEETA